MLVVSIMSCDSKRVFDEYQSVSGAWHKDRAIEFKLVPPDTIKAYNLFINVRNTEAYKFSNLYVIVEFNYPNGKTVKDTLSYAMARKDGTLLGTGFSDVKENKLWYKGYETPFVFEEVGEYRVSIEQAMRENGRVNGVDKLEGISDVGFRIEQAQTD